VHFTSNFEFKCFPIVRIVSLYVQEGSNTTLFGPLGEKNKGNKKILLQLGNNINDYLFHVHHGNYNPSRKANSISNQFEIGSRVLICLQLELRDGKSP